MGDFRRSVRDCIYGSPYVRKGCDVGDFRAASVCGSICCDGTESVPYILDVRAGNGRPLFLKKRGACKDGNSGYRTFACAAFSDPSLRAASRGICFSDRAVSAGALSADSRCRIVGGVENICVEPDIPFGPGLDDPPIFGICAAVPAFGAVIFPIRAALHGVTDGSVITIGLHV